MRHRVIACALAAACLHAAAASAAPPPLEAYGQLPDCEMAAMSASGSRYAFIGIAGDRRRLIVGDGSDSALIAQDLGNQKIRRIAFAGDDLLLVWVSNTSGLGPEFTMRRYEIDQVLAVDIPARKSNPLMQRAPSLGGAFGSYGTRFLDGRWYGYFGGITLENSRNGDAYWKDGKPDLYRVDLQSGAQQMLSEAQGDDAGRRRWLIGADGGIAEILDEDGNSGKWSIHAGKGGATIASGAAKLGSAYLVGLGRTPGTFVFSRPDAAGLDHWIEMPLSGGAETPLLEGIDATALFDGRDGHMIGYIADGDQPQPQFYDPRLEKRMRATQKAFPGLSTHLIDWSDDFGKLIVETDGPADSGTWWTVDLATGKAANIAQSYQNVPPEAVGPVRMITYKAADGLAMSGVLTLPPGKPASAPLPLIVMPHGGPAARDYPVFDWWAQAFASRGYAVFQPNFRGSTGYGPDFLRAGHNQWGGKMQSDLSDGVDELARLGIVDPKRACIVGASYGGYAALAGVTLQQGRYRCAVSVAGVADLGALFAYRQTATTGFNALRAQWADTIGTGRALKDISPVTFADRADAPILLIHGKDDTVVPYEQSRAMQAALQRAGKPVELVTLTAEDHWLSRSETRLALLKASVAFVEKYDPAD